MSLARYKKTYKINLIEEDLTKHKVDYLLGKGVQEKINAKIGYYLESRSENTKIAFHQDMEKLLVWCKLHQFCAIPIHPDVLRSFVIEMSETLAPSTIQRRLSTIGNLHKILDLKSPCSEPQVNSAVVHICEHSPYKKRQASPARKNIIRSVELEIDSNNIRDVRDFAILQLAYSTLLRRSEVARVKVEDIEFDPSGDGVVKIDKIKSKKGTKETYYAYLTPDATFWVKKWLKMSKIREGDLFVGLTKYGTLRPTTLTGHTISTILKKLGFLVDEKIKWSGHSTRVGAAQDMVASGIDHTKAMNAGRWKDHKTFLGYVRKLSAKENGMAEMYRR